MSIRQQKLEAIQGASRKMDKQNMRAAPRQKPEIIQAGRHNI